MGVIAQKNPKMEHQHKKFVEPKHEHQRRHPKNENTNAKKFMVPEHGNQRLFEGRFLASDYDSLLW